MCVFFRSKPCVWKRRALKIAWTGPTWKNRIQAFIQAKQSTEGVRVYACPFVKVTWTSLVLFKKKRGHSLPLRLSNLKTHPAPRTLSWDRRDKHQSVSPKIWRVRLDEPGSELHNIAHKCKTALSVQQTWNYSLLCNCSKPLLLEGKTTTPLCC